MKKKTHQELAGKIRDFLKEKNIKLEHRSALELVARLEGHEDLHEMQAIQKQHWNGLPGRIEVGSRAPRNQVLPLKTPEGVIAEAKRQRREFASRDVDPRAQEVARVPCDASDDAAVNAVANRNQDNNSSDEAEGWVVYDRDERGQTKVIRMKEAQTLYDTDVVLGIDIPFEIRLKLAEVIAHVLNREMPPSILPVGQAIDEQKEAERPRGDGYLRAKDAFHKAVGPKVRIVEMLRKLPSREGFDPKSVTCRNLYHLMSPAEIVKAHNFGTVRCYRFEYDTKYSGGIYSDIGKVVYIPCEVVNAVRTPMYAFKWFAKIDPKHLIRWSDVDVFDSNGKSLN